MATFEPPCRDERLRALGSLKGVPRRIQALLLSDEHFQPIRAPSRGDWLDTYAGSAQTFDDYTREAFVPEPGRRGLCLLPLEGPSPVPVECLTRFRRFTEAFFMLDVRELPPWRLDAERVGRRWDPEWGLYQWCATNILEGVAARRPEDAVGVLALTTADIYPHALMDYSCGLASATERVAVCSLARFGPPYCSEPEPAPGRLACRGCRLVAHEIGHLLGLRHCVYYACLMNGSTTPVEGDIRPLHLCPIDLRKLHWLLGFDPDERYRRLARMWRELGARDEAAWSERCLAVSTDPVSHR